MCPSGAAFAIPLGPTNPPLTIIEEETLVFRRAGFSPALWLLVPTFLLRNAPPWVTPLASLQMRILSYRTSRRTRENPNNQAPNSKQLTFLNVIPAEAGNQEIWIPAFAGTT